MNDKTENVNLFSQDFIYKNLMGPNCLKILDELIEDINIKPGMCILDLGCGTALTSIFLAKKFDVTVFATDLWINPSENYKRIAQFNLTHKVYPIYADAHNLPYSHDFFDIVVSVGAYNCFGCEQDYLEKSLLPFVKKDAAICVSTPGIKNGFDEKIPEELIPFWKENINFHSAQWWNKHWSKVDSIFIEKCTSVNCHKEAWEDWLKCDNPYAKKDVNMIKAENGKYFDTIQMIARKK
jgi:cyclopropane fatty-acyl-phospholipid synthase-like methyltransferase